MTQFALDTEAEAADKIADADDLVKARVKGIERESRDAKAINAARQAEIAELDEQIRSRRVQIGAAEREVLRSGKSYRTVGTEIDPKTGQETVTVENSDYIEKLKRLLENDETTRRQLQRKKSKKSFLDQIIQDLGVGKRLPLIPAKPLTWAPESGESIAQAYVREFSTLATLVKEEEACWNAGRTREEMKASVSLEIDRTADAGAPEFDGYHRGNSIGHRGRQVATSPQIGWPRERIGIDAIEASDAPKLIAWLFRDQLKAASFKRIDELYSDDGAVAAADKPAMLAEFEKTIWHQRRVVEAAYLYARANGITDLNRPRNTPTEILLDILPWKKSLAQAVAGDAPNADDGSLADTDTLDFEYDDSNDQ